jgi:outer membrane immunogenic protein
VLGVETDISLTAVSGTATGTSNLAVAPITRVQSTTSQQGTEWYGTSRGRLGWLATPNLLVFGTGGLAYGRTSVAATDAFSGFVFGTGAGFTFTCLTAGVPCFAGAGAAERTGWTAGGGAELRLDAHWSAKIEYLFVDLGTQQLTVSALAPTPGTTPSSFTAAFRDQMNVVRFGLNYRI